MGVRQGRHDRSADAAGGARHDRHRARFQTEDCERELRGLARPEAAALAGPIGEGGAGSRSVPMAPAQDPNESPWLTGRRAQEAPLPRVILVEENPAHLELDLIGLLPVVGEPADLINALIYAWERDWGNAAISVAVLAPMVGSAGTLTRVAARTNGVPRPTPRLTQAALEHIVARHWWSAGTGPRVGKFADDLSLSMLATMIDAALRHGRVKPNTYDRLGAIYEIDVGRIIGTNGSGRLTSRLKVILDGSGEILSAFPY